jgi:hypothetical protein
VRACVRACVWRKAYHYSLFYTSNVVLRVRFLCFRLCGRSAVIATIYI